MQIFSKFLGTTFVFMVFFTIFALRSFSLTRLLMRWIGKIWNFYIEGFRDMTLGKTLWMVILIKLLVIFLILKVFFFPNYIGEHSEDGKEAEFVTTELLERASE